ncbi:alpha/beta fold hydrolase [Leucobacter sp. OLDS2]|uniref:alpha/beta fold hydrolase n=1 Tax=Leucobacter sp. OLDS2 TaxID=1914919 RepID=UPI000C1A3C04|nr:alpha/beta fold hydrolase [Leucobacter sp. OLDS2]PII97310.1 alpha/beta hydrolase [Leucobacter sp. OLDS2]
MIELVAGGIRGVSRVSPRLGGDLAYRAFFSTAPRMRVRDSMRPVHESARRGALRLPGGDAVVFEWGAGERSVRLLHGWKGRASQFAPLVERLVGDGFRVIAFDAPAHGDSSGRHADVRDWIAAAEALAERHGSFDLLVGHSFGSLAALTLARSTLPTPRVAVVAGAASPEAFVEAFVSDFRLPSASADRLRERFRSRLGVDEAELVRRYDAARDPLPAGTELLLAHDRGDRRLADRDALRLREVHGDRARLLRTEGLGHARILAADAVLDAISGFARAGLDGVGPASGNADIGSALVDPPPA